MKNFIKITLSFFIFTLLFTPNLKAKEEKLQFDPKLEISLDFQDANLMDILKIFSMQSGLNFIASESVRNRKITLYLDKVPLQDAMDKLFDANNLAYELDKEANMFIVKDMGKPPAETITKVFYLKNSSVPSASINSDSKDNLGTEGGDSAGNTMSILTAVTQVLTEQGKISEDSRTNSLIITDIAPRFSAIEGVIAHLDIPQPQVLLEVEMLDVSKNTVDKMGFNWANAASYSMTIASASRATNFPLSSFAKGLTGNNNITAGSVTFPTNLTMVLDFLRTNTDSKYLARPRIMTLNNQPAEIKIATQETVGSVTITQGQGTASTTTTSTERVETGVTLRVTPQINIDSGEITMFIMPKVKDATAGTLGTTSYKDPEERSTKSIVRVKDGDTVIIGGLIRNQTSTTENRIPILGDIPVLGALFRHKYKDKDRERELLVFITPRIIKEPKLELAQLKKKIINIPEREQDMNLGISREAMIDESLNNFKKLR